VARRVRDRGTKRRPRWWTTCSRVRFPRDSPHVRAPFQDGRREYACLAETPRSLLGGRDHEVRAPRPGHHVSLIFSLGRSQSINFPLMSTGSQGLGLRNNQW